MYPTNLHAGPGMQCSQTYLIMNIFVQNLQGPVSLGTYFLKYWSWPIPAPPLISCTMRKSLSLVLWLYKLKNNARILSNISQKLKIFLKIVFRKYYLKRKWEKLLDAESEWLTELTNQLKPFIWARVSLHAWFCSAFSRFLYSKHFRESHNELKS